MRNRETAVNDSAVSSSEPDRDMTSSTSISRNVRNGGGPEPDSSSRVGDNAGGHESRKFCAGETSSGNPEWGSVAHREIGDGHITSAVSERIPAELHPAGVYRPVRNR